MLRLRRTAVYFGMAFLLLLAAGMPARCEGVADDFKVVFRSVALSGRAAPGGGIFGDFTFGTPTIDDSDTVIFEASLYSTSNSLGFFRSGTAGLTSIFRLGAANPAGGTITTISNAFTAEGTVAFVGLDTQGQQNIFLLSGGKLHNLARTGKPAPGGGTFSYFDKVCSNPAGQVFFHAGTAGGSGEGLYLADKSTVRNLAELGGAAPNGSTFTYFEASTLIVNLQGLAVFYAGTAAGGGLFMATSDDVQLVAATGSGAPEGGVYSSLTG